MTVSWESMSLGTARVEGLDVGSSADIVVAVHNGQLSEQVTVTGSSLGPAHVPEFGPVESLPEGFVTDIVNFDPKWSYVVVAGAGTVSATGELTVTNVPGGSIGRVTVEAQRTGFEVGLASASGLALPPETTTTSSTTPTTVVSSTVPAVLPPSSAPVTTTESSTPAIVTSARKFVSLRSGRSMALRVLAVRSGVVVPSKAKLSATIRRSSTKRCRTAGSRIVAVSAGDCRITLAVSAPGRRPARANVVVRVAGR